MLPCRVTDYLHSVNRAAVAIGLLIVLLAAAPAAAASEAWTVRSDWSRHFAEAGVRGTLVVVDERTHPASRWVLRDEFQVFRWDGTRRDIESWNRDQDLRSSMRNSVVWVYQHIARSIGEDGERRYLQKIGYGNADPSGGIDRFWLDGKLAISAEEQVTFLQRLYRNELPFRVEHQRLVKDVLVVEAGRDWILRAKTGWQARLEPQVGWWVGWVEWPQGPVFFALNIDMPNAGGDLPKREAIARAALRSIGALPSEPTHPSGSQEPK